MIYEARPNVTVDAAALCIRSGNACVLRGGTEAQHSNQALAAVVSRALEQAGLPAACVQCVPTQAREAIDALLLMDDCFDLVIPRGGEALIRRVVEKSRIAVVRHYKGVCHVYVDASADLSMAARIVENAKVQRPGVCNALEDFAGRCQDRNAIFADLPKPTAEPGRAPSRAVRKHGPFFRTPRRLA